MRKKLNLIATHFAEINKINTSLGKPQSNEFITKEANKIKSEHISQLSNKIPLCTFSESNSAHSPTVGENLQNFFTSFSAVEKKI